MLNEEHTLFIGVSLPHASHYMGACYRLLGSCIIDQPLDTAVLIGWIGVSAESTRQQQDHNKCEKFC